MTIGNRWTRITRRPRVPNYRRERAALTLLVARIHERLRRKRLLRCRPDPARRIETPSGQPRHFSERRLIVVAENVTHQRC